MIDTFLRHLATVRRLSPATVESYGRTLRSVEGQAGELVSLDRPRLTAYLATVGGSSATQARVLSTLRSFYRWAQGAELVSRDPTAGIDRPKVPRVLRRKALTAKEAGALVSEAGAYGSLVQTLYLSGARISELVGLTWADVRRGQTGWTAVIHGKGGKDRVIPIVLPSDRKSGEGSGRIWGLTRNGAWRMLRSAGNRAGIKGVHPHQLRHTCATQLIEAGAPLELVADLLGHANIDTTRIYAVYSSTHLLREHARFHPGAARKTRANHGPGTSQGNHDGTG